jgi:molybdate transport system substrate-binding protein
MWRNRRGRSVPLGLGILSAVALVTGCGGGDINSTLGPVPAGPLDDVRGQLTVRADSSLREVFELVADQVERRHPDLTIRLQFVPDASDRAADAAVVASADRTGLDALQSRGVVGQATPFAQEVLALVVAPRNPGKVSTLRDVRRPGVSLALCSASVPCGDAAQAMLTRAEIEPPSPVDVTDTEAALNRVTAGGADAGLVWSSDIRGTSGRTARERGVQLVGLSADPQEEIRLAGLGSRALLVATSPSGNTGGASAFVAQLRSSEGQQLLRADGYR